MWRSIHSVIGLVFALLVMALSLTGAILATQPVYNAYTANAPSGTFTVADSLRLLYENNRRISPEVLKSTPSGEYKLTYSKGNKRRERILDFETGKLVRPAKEPKIYGFIKRLHRSFLLGENGRLLSAAGGIVMTLLCFSGLALLLRRLGGWRQLLASMSLRGSANLHSNAGRAFLLPLVITSLSALWLSGITFDLVSAGSDTPPAYPESLKELDPVDPWELHGLQAIPLSTVKEVIFPIPQDWFDVWTVKTDSEYIFIDQFTGDVLSRESLPIMAQVYDWIYFLHTAEGAAPWAIVLFLSSLTVPFFAVTGTLVWWRNKRQGRGKVKNNAGSGQAGTLIAVGSEGGATWGFAKALHAGLVANGESVRLIAMNELGKSYPNLERLLILASTYGDGDAPKTASRFLTKLAASSLKDVSHATLAFGDKAFPDYCGYARKVDHALQQKWGDPLLPIFEIDKQSAQAFQHWCAKLGKVIDQSLDIAYEPPRPKTRSLTLLSNHSFGDDIGAPISVLRFTAKKLPRHQPGDLVAIFPPGCNVPRLYSLGSDSRRDGYLEICVRKQSGGLCSSWLCSLQADAEIDVAVEINERFKLPQRKPVVMIGAGTGIVPFTGMIRQNRKQRPIDLFWGGRHPTSDALYEKDIADWITDNRLTTFEPAWSRLSQDQRYYVQDKVREQRTHLQARLRAGATIMVCGGQAMAAAVRQEIDLLAQEIGLSSQELKRQNRYLEDVY